MSTATPLEGIIRHAVGNFTHADGSINLKGFWQGSLNLALYQLLTQMIWGALVFHLLYICSIESRDHEATLLELQQRLGLVRYVLYVTLFGPFLETLIFQWILIEALRMVQASAKWQFYVALSAFCAAHFSNSIESGLGPGLIGGAFLTASYLSWRTINVGVAFWATFIQHAIYNMMVTQLSFIYQ